MLDWMVWTTPVAVFFGCVALTLVAMTVWEVHSPSVLRKGWLPISTTRGDRLFIGLMFAAFVNLAWVGLGEKLMDWFALSEEPTVWWSFGASMLLLLLILRKG